MDTEGATNLFGLKGLGNSQVSVPHSDGSLESPLTKYAFFSFLLLHILIPVTLAFVNELAKLISAEKRHQRGKISQVSGQSNKAKEILVALFFCCFLKLIHKLISNPREVI